jgi:hypothetical protein
LSLLQFFANILTGRLLKKSSGAWFAFNRTVIVCMPTWNAWQTERQTTFGLVCPGRAFLANATADLVLIEASQANRTIRNVLAGFYRSQTHRTLIAISCTRIGKQAWCAQETITGNLMFFIIFAVI